MNRVTIVGRLGNDPDQHTFDDGKSITNLSVATSERYKDKNEEWQEATTWHRVVVRGNQAGPCAQFLSKGSQVAVDGAYISRKYTDNDGNERTAYEVKAQRVEFLGSKGDSNTGGSNERSEEVPF